MMTNNINGFLQKEGDEKEFKYRGFICIIKRIQEMGHLCGYVGIPKSHRFYGKSYRDIEDMADIKVHGGLTFSNEFIPDMEKETAGRDLWFIGFDCAHAGDLMPYMLQGMTLNTMHLKFMTDVLEGQENFLKTTETYKDMKYVSKQLRSLVRQVISLSKE
jgi:hypothetical protein